MSLRSGTHSNYCSTLILYFPITVPLWSSQSEDHSGSPILLLVPLSLSRSFCHADRFTRHGNFEMDQILRLIIGRLCRSLCRRWRRQGFTFYSNSHAPERSIPATSSESENTYDLSGNLTSFLSAWRILRNAQNTGQTRFASFYSNADNNTSKLASGFSDNSLRHLFIRCLYSLHRKLFCVKPHPLAGVLIIEASASLSRRLVEKKRNSNRRTYNVIFLAEVNR